MKVTKRQLQRIIKEEKAKLNENARREARQNFEFAADDLIAAYIKDGINDPSGIHRAMVDIIDNLIADASLDGEIDSSRY